MANHFDSIADIYNKVWYFSAQYQASMLDNIISGLQLGQDDVLADVGGGTGVYTQLLRQQVGLKQAYCIEPSQGMCQEATKLDDIEAFCTDAEGFMALNIPFTKVLLKEVVHHIPARDTFWHYLRQTLPADGRLLIVTRPKETALPLFAEAKAVFRQKQPHHETLVQELEAAGFAATVKFHPYSFTLAKATWFDMIRNRFMSDLAGFSEAEIEAGLQAIEQQYPGEDIMIPDTIIYLAAQPC